MRRRIEAHRDTHEGRPTAGGAGGVVQDTPELEKDRKEEIKEIQLRFVFLVGDR